MEDRFRDFAHSFATVRLVEQCATACEMFAEELYEEPGVSGLQEQLSECIASCSAFLGAAVRESRHAFRYAMIFGEVCAETAALCARRPEKAARCVEVMCRASVNLVHEDYGMVESN